MKNKNAFTLIELSIVLVIIGLIVGGVLVGQDLIAGAQLRNSITKIEKIKTAVYTFKNKYNGLPGDLPNAVSFGLTGNPSGNQPNKGDGDRVIESSVSSDGYNQHLTAFEQGWFWHQLEDANLFESNVTKDAAWDENYSIPRGIQNFSGAGKEYYFPYFLGNEALLSIYSKLRVNYFEISNINSSSTTGQTQRQNGLTTYQAYQIDSKIDDGNPRKGRIIATGGDNWYAGTVAIAGFNNCVAVSEEYNLARENTKICSLQVKAGF